MIISILIIKLLIIIINVYAWDSWPAQDKAPRQGFAMSHTTKGPQHILPPT